MLIEKNIFRFVLSIILSSLSFQPYAGYVEVVRDSNVYELPTSQSNLVSRVDEGATLTEIGEGATTDNYWHIELEDGRDGWIYRSRVRFTDYESMSLYTAGDCEAHIRYGIPNTPDLMLCRIGYVAGFNYETLVPDWVSYIATYDSVHTNGGERKDKFLPDQSVPEEFRIDENIYKGSGYDRGHFADSSSIDRTQLANDQTFLMTNMSPQRPWFNRDVAQYSGVWGAIEDAMSCWVKKRERNNIYVIMGPIYDENIKKLKDVVAIPKGFWKVFLDLDTLGTITFLIPDQESARNDADNADKYIKTIDEVEQVTGLDLLSEINDSIETVIENSTGNIENWPLYNRVPTNQSTTGCKIR